jgi:hypothetical protein
LVLVEILVVGLVEVLVPTQILLVEVLSESLLVAPSTLQTHLKTPMKQLLQQQV